LPRSAASFQKLIRDPIKMKKSIVKIIVSIAFVCLAAVIASAQANPKPAVHSDSSAGATAAKVPVIIVGSAAKATWVTTKFTAKYVVLPVGKAVVVEAAPTIAKFAVKNSVKYVLPYVVGLSLL
jgi:hypothetical protein